MARGENTAHHPGRKVHVGSPAWSKWSSSGQFSGKTSYASTHTDDPNYPHTLEVWHGHEDDTEPAGYHASYQHVEGYYGRPGAATREEGNYAVGPFRSPERAKQAGVALANRVQRGGDTKRYWTNPSYTTAKEMRGD